MAQEDLGETRYHYKIIFEDNQLDPKQTATALQKLINVDRVDAVISCSEECANVVASVARQKHFIHFATACLDTIVADGKFNFIHWATPEEEIQCLTQKLREEKLTRIAAFMLNNQGGQALTDQLKKLIQGTNFQLVYHSFINYGERDFRIPLQKAKQAKPDVYFVFFIPPELEIFAKQFKELNIPQPLTCTEVFSISSEPETFEERWYVDAADLTEAFQERFLNKYHHKNTLTVGNCYDLIKIIAHAYENYPSQTKPSTAEIAQFLIKIKDFDGSVGKLNIDEQGIIHSKPILKEIRNGKPVVIQKDF